VPFSFNSCSINGLIEIQPKIFSDNRGYFFESWSQRDFDNAGISERFVQDNQSFSVKGVLRGLHFQLSYPQAKLVRVVKGEIFDVAVDLRSSSSTYGKWHGVILNEEKNNQFFIPNGFAHGFLVLSDVTIFSYKCSDFYHPEDERGILWNDPDVNINWPDVGIEYILSEKDKDLPFLSTLRKV